MRLDRIQTKFLNDVGVDETEALIQFNLAPWKARRDMAKLDHQRSHQDLMNCQYSERLLYMPRTFDLTGRPNGEVDRGNALETVAGIAYHIATGQEYLCVQDAKAQRRPCIRKDTSTCLGPQHDGHPAALPASPLLTSRSAPSAAPSTSRAAPESWTTAETSDGSAIVGHGYLRRLCCRGR